MTFEGEHKQVVLRGIERATANGVAQDGGMNEVINLIPRDGSYVPYAPTELLPEYDSTYHTNSNVVMVRVHHTSTGDNTILVYPNEYKIGRNGSITKTVQNCTVKNIVFVGNRMDLETADGIEHWLWKDGAYINRDDLNIHENGQSALPYVSFKVSRGIFDGSKVYKSARYVKKHKHFTDADSANCDVDVLSKYVRELGSVGSDAMALIDSIRHMGGITGYVLVAAAWRIKGSDASHPQYVMASPVMLMGAPEIYMKDGQYEEEDNYGVATRYNMPSTTYFLDMYDYVSVFGTTPDSEKEAFDKLWNISDSDDRDIEDMTENEHAFIEPLENGDLCILRTYQYDAETGEKEMEKYSTSFGSDAVVVLSEQQAIVERGLRVNKYALYDHGSLTGTANGDAEYRAVRISHGSGNMLQYQLSSALPEQYKDEIDRLCIFVSPVISPYKTNDSSGIRFESDYVGEREDKYDGFFFDSRRTNSNHNIYHTGCGGSFSPVMKSDQEIRDEIKNVAGLYKVAEVQLNELTAGSWLKVNLSGGKLGTDRMVQSSDTMLKLSDIQPVGFTNGHIFGYNERLHVFNYQKDEVYRLPYQSIFYEGGDGQYADGHYLSNNEFFIEVTDSNNSVTFYRFFNKEKYLNPLISCADLDAKKIRVIYRKMPQEDALTGEIVYMLGVTEYTPIEIAGIISGYISSDLKPILLSTSTSIVEESAYSAIGHDRINPDSYSYGKNEIRVSNPGSIVFDITRSYKLGHGEIIGMARLAMGLSQDNYSKFPLVVFCTDGIYTLGVDSSGKYAYTDQTPLSRVVCSNPDAICEIDGAVLFPTEYGLQMVTTDGVKPVVTQANGKPKNLPKAYDAVDYNGLDTYYNAISHAQIVQLLADVDDVDFIAYIQNAYTRIKYLHAINSVIVYNRSKQYSYLIDLGTWMVTKIEQRMLYDDGDYPKQKFYAQITKNGTLTIVPMQFNYFSGDNNSRCLLVTRPMALETLQHKTVYRVVLRGAFEYKKAVNVQEADKYMGMYVYGSLDGNNWDYLNGTEKKLTNNRFHDIGVETHHVSYKYMMVVIAGTLSSDSHIEGLEITSRDKYVNKLK